ncbi:MAG: hypothetical protein AMXMBFR33_71550 [Candidatus Xenobia bacterium]
MRVRASFWWSLALLVLVTLTLKSEGVRKWSYRAPARAPWPQSRNLHNSMSYRKWLVYTILPQTRRVLEDSERLMSAAPTDSRAALLAEVRRLRREVLDRYPPTTLQRQWAMDLLRVYEDLAWLLIDLEKGTSSDARARLDRARARFHNVEQSNRL